MKSKFEQQKIYFRPLKIGKLLQNGGPTEILTLLSSYFSFWTMDMWAKKILSGECLVNEQKVDTNYLLKHSDRLTYLQLPCDEPEVIKDYQVLYEDAHLFIICKPSNLPIHPCGKYYHNSLTSLFKFDNIDFDPVHRIDRQTSGILICAKSPQVKESIRAQFQAKTVAKQYIAFVSGPVPADSFTIEKPIGVKYQNRTRRRMGVMEEGREALTTVEVVETKGDFSKVKVFPKTGRTNQIRVHLAFMNLPIVGDGLYGPWEEDHESTPRLALHAHKITFVHPVTNKPLTVTSPLPLELDRLWDNLKELKKNRQGGC